MTKQGAQGDCGVLVVGVVQLLPGAGARLRRAAEAFARDARAEPGCRDFDLHLSANDTLATIEWWRDQEAAAAHLAAPHTRAFMRAVALFTAPEEEDGLDAPPQPWLATNRSSQWMV